MHRLQVDPELAEVCRREHAHLVGLLALDVGDGAVAEELAWATMVRLHEWWPHIPRESRHAWLSTTALGLARSRWRRRHAGFLARRRHRSAGGAVDGRAGVADGTGEASEVEPAGARAVRSAVAALPASQRAALILRYHAGLSVDETATALRCPPEVVRSLTYSAVNALRLAFGDLDEMVELELVADG